MSAIRITKAGSQEGVHFILNSTCRQARAGAVLTAKIGEHCLYARSARSTARHSQRAAAWRCSDRIITTMNEVISCIDHPPSPRVKFEREPHLGLAQERRSRCRSCASRPSFLGECRMAQQVRLARSAGAHHWRRPHVGRRRRWHHRVADGTLMHVENGSGSFHLCLHFGLGEFA